MAEIFEANAKAGNKVYIITCRCEDYSAYRELDMAGFGSLTEARKKFNQMFKEEKEQDYADETIAEAKDSMSWGEYWGIMSFNNGEMIYELREVIVGDKGDFFFDAETEVFNASMYNCPECGFAGYQEEFLDAETFDVEFNEWADQEMNSHGKNISFKDWADDEGMKHGNTEITDWAQHEDESHDARYGAENFNAESEECYVCDKFFNQVYVCDGCGFQCCEVDIDGNLIPVHNDDGTINDYCITCYEEQKKAESFSAENCQVCKCVLTGKNRGSMNTYCDDCYVKLGMSGAESSLVQQAKGIDTFTEPFEEMGVPKWLIGIGGVVAAITGINYLSKKL